MVKFALTDDSGYKNCHNILMTRPHCASGNAFIYVLVAVALFAGLSFALSRSNDAAPQNEISAAQIQTAASEILSYAGQAQSAVDQMMMNGTQISTMNFLPPAHADFNTTTTIHKLYHPDGGGLQYRSLPASAAGGLTTGGFYIGRVTNVEYSTPSTASDILLLVTGLNEAVCRHINQKITGQSNFPTTVVNFDTWAYLMIFGSYPTTGTVGVTLSNTQCPTCEGKPSYCVKGSDGYHTYYHVLFGR